MILVYLILAHLVADFVLQPFELIKWKAKSWKGIAIHALIHMLTYLAVLFVYITDLKIVLVLAALSIIHFLIDCLKIEKEKNSSKFIGFYLFDQFLHMATLGLAAYALWDQKSYVASTTMLGGLYSNLFIGIGLILFVLITFVAEITKFQFLRVTNKSAVFKPDYTAMLKRFFIFSMLYGVLMLLVVQDVVAKVIAMF